jgi:hypothetical protein
VNIGITGSRVGPVDPLQEERLICMFRNFESLSPILHHGACVGVDEVVSYLAFTMKNYYIIAHPPTNSKLISQSSLDHSHEKREPLEYIERNHCIVDESTLLIVVPSGFKEELRSGTWATYRYSISLKKPTIIIYPDGTIKEEFT